MLKALPTLSALAFLLTAVPVQAQTKAKVGLLTCKTAPSVGLIIGSRQRMQCVFASEGGSRRESYAGAITRVGLDVGISAGGVMAWAVFAPTSALPHGALRGNYVGASGDIALGVGAGANVLVGGSRNTISLQPLSLEGQVGVNLALGVANLALR